MNKRITEIFCLITILIATPALAQDKSEENFNFANSKVSFSGLVTSSDSYQLEASYHYMFNRYIGLGEHSDIGAYGMKMAGPQKKTGK